ncbi:MAG: hypothetical protein EOO39_45425, partial [Cytophagaceae bacterium]
MNYTELFKPNGRPDRSSYGVMVMAQVVIAAIIWFLSQSPLLPTPVEIVSAFGRLTREENLIQELWTSMALSLEAMLYATII